MRLVNEPLYREEYGGFAGDHLHCWEIEGGFLEEASERDFEECIGSQQIVMGRRCPRKN